MHHVGRARVEIATGQSHDVRRRFEARQTPMNAPVPVETLGCIVGQDNTEIQIAVRSGFPPRFRPKEVDANRPIKLYQPPGDLFDRR
jgi:hypothetical protein